MHDAVLLEWEGVLADTGAARRDALCRALADEGVPWTVAAQDACAAGLDVRSAATAAVAGAGRDDATLAELVALRASRAFVAQLANGFSLTPGAADFVSAAAHRARIAIVTRAGRAETELALELSGLAGSVVALSTADDVSDPPPAAALYLRALGQLSRVRVVPAARAVAVVHSAHTAQAARRAGVRTVAVGAAAHVAVEADAAVDGVAGLTVDAIAALMAGAPAARRA
jgi:beta-phosphoglucomutase-like phosphatase (HAD superfamily)